MDASPPSELHELPAADGTRLSVRRWPPPEGTVRGTILIVHGLGEHAGRYEHVAERLRGEGWAVVGYDHRGHGRSGGARGGLHRPDDLLTDLAAVVDSVREDERATLVLLGHSMGGLVAARFAADAVRPVDALILSSPVLASRLSAFQRALLAVLSRLAPDLPVGNGLSPDRLSHDPEVVRAYRSDPLVHDRITAKLVRFVQEGGREVLGRAPGWAVPTLLLWAGDDAYVDAAGSAAFAARAPADVVQGQCFERHYHELFNEVEKEPVLKALGEWLAERFPPSVAAAPSP